VVLSLRVLAHCEVGLVRSSNQDSAYASPRLLVVADGMGGAAAGDVASAIAIKHLAEADAHYEGDAMLDTLSAALTAANDDLADLIDYDPDYDGMGTTVCGALFSGTQLGVVHIGDSRAYLVRAGKVKQITHDHSWVQSLIDDGRLTPQAAAVHPKRSLLLKVLNGQPVHSPDLELVDVEAGDRLLFCSDGLSGMISPEALARGLRVSDPAKAMKQLVAAARHAGGFDNITAILADVVAQDDALDAQPPQVLGAAATVDVPVVPGAGGAAPASLERSDGNAGEPADDGETLAAADRIPSGRHASRPVTLRPRWLTPVIVAAVVVALLAGALGGARAWVSRQYYLGQTADGLVAIYQGVPARVAWVDLGHEVEGTTTRVADLPVYYADQVRAASIRPATLSAARDSAAELARRAQDCVAQRETVSPPDGTVGATPSTPGGSAPTLTATLAPSSPPTVDDREACP